MRLFSEPRLPTEPDWMRHLTKLLRDVANQVNKLTEGRIEADHSAVIAPPTAGDWKAGDKLRNSSPTELGSASSKYVVIGWICTASGTPGTWLEMRCLTGN